MVAPILRPSQVPLEKACRAFSALCSSSSGMTTRPAVRVSSVSGYRILEMAKEAGIDMIQDDTKASALSPRPMYPTKTEPEMVAKPQVII